MQTPLQPDGPVVTQETPLGIWRQCRYVNGCRYVEFVSHRRVLGLPMIHYVRGPDPQTGKRKVARGIFAVGRVAIGLVALGQVAIGFLAMGQLALGVFLGLGQAATGVIALGQAAGGAFLALGQFTAGMVAIGQFGAGQYVLAQFGLGEHVWDVRGADLDAVEFFTGLLP